MTQLPNDSIPPRRSCRIFLSMPAAKSRKPVRDSAQFLGAIAQIAERRSVHEAFAWLRAQEEKLSQRQMEITRIPAPPLLQKDVLLKGMSREIFLLRLGAGTIFVSCRPQKLQVVQELTVKTCRPKRTRISSDSSAEIA